MKNMSIICEHDFGSLEILMKKFYSYWFIIRWQILGVYAGDEINITILKY